MTKNHHSGDSQSEIQISNKPIQRKYDKNKFLLSPETSNSPKYKGEISHSSIDKVQSINISETPNDIDFGIIDNLEKEENKREPNQSQQFENKNLEDKKSQELNSIEEEKQPETFGPENSNNGSSKSIFSNLIRGRGT